MSVFIHDIATAVPPFSCDQQHVREMMKKHIEGDRKTQAIIHRIYSQSGIEQRHSVVEDFVPNSQASLYFRKGVKSNPDTATRNKVYEKESKKLFIEVGRQLLDNNTHIAADEITHVITVSCTGFYAPGPDYEIVKALDLKPNTRRFHLGFMGCYAALPALKMAQAFCASNPEANVLLVCAELCTLHFQFKNEIDNLISGSVFADGASGVLVSSKKPQKPAFELHQFASALAPKGEKDMAWTIGNFGFNMVLSTYVPDIIQANISSVLQPIYDQYQLTRQDIDYWAIHPGGRSILDKIEDALELEPEQISASRKTLAQYGNMSSATVLFVLKKLLASNLADGQKVMPMAFGPGLTIESGLFTAVKPTGA